MAYSAPRTWAVGEYPTAAELNSNLRDNVSFLANPPSCRVYHNANQSIADSTQSTLAFNSERYDTDTMHDTVTTNSRITFKTAGLFTVGANIEWASNASSFRFVAIRLNGATIIAQVLLPPASGVATDQLLSCVYKFAVNDYVEIRVQQNSGGALNVAAVGNLSPEFWATWIGLG